MDTIQCFNHRASPYYQQRDQLWSNLNRIAKSTVRPWMDPQNMMGLVLNSSTAVGSTEWTN